MNINEATTPTAHMHLETREGSYFDSCVCLVRGLTLVSQKGLGEGGEE